MLFSVWLPHHDGYCQGASTDSPSMIHTCDCSVFHFGKGASTALHFLLQLTPVVILARTDTKCSDNRHLKAHIWFGRPVASVCMCVYYLHTPEGLSDVALGDSFVAKLETGILCSRVTVASILSKHMYYHKLTCRGPLLLHCFPYYLSPGYYNNITPCHRFCKSFCHLS